MDGDKTAEGTAEGTLSAEVIPEHVLNFYRMNKSVRQRYGSQDPRGKDIPTDWLLVYIEEARARKTREAEEKKEKDRLRLKADRYSRASKTRKLNEGSRAREQEIEFLYQSYIEQFDAPTPNDREDLHQLARLQCQAKDLDQRTEEIKERKDEDQAKLAKTLAEERNIVLRSIKDLQERLGISRRERERSRTEKSGSDIIQEVVQDAKALLDTEIEEIICPNCRSLTGWLWLLAGKGKPHHLKFLCPCGSELESRAGY